MAILLSLVKNSVKMLPATLAGLLKCQKHLGLAIKEVHLKQSLVKLENVNFSVGCYVLCLVSICILIS